MWKRKRSGLGLSRCLIVGLLGLTSASLGIPGSAVAHTVGGLCNSAVEHCERWSVTMQGPPRPSGQRPDNFPSAIAVTDSTVFAGITAVNFNVESVTAIADGKL